jgi:MerR family transcriptional regulator, light-induced transcriptional regulator
VADERLTLTDVAEELGLHYMTIYRYVRTGLLPATQTGSTWLVARDDLEHLRGQGQRRRRRPAAQTSSTTSARLEARLLAGDELGAWQLVEAALTSDVQPDGLLLDVVAPAMTSIGKGWATGRLSVADEHQASVVLVRVLGRLGARFGQRGVKRGTVVVTAPAGDQHSLPVTLAANLLRWHGFKVVELGSDTPSGPLAEAVAQELARAKTGPLAVGIGCTSRGALRSAASAIKAVRRRAPGVPVLVGGGAITGQRQAESLGADFYTGKRGDDLLKVMDGLARDRPQSPVALRARRSPSGPPSP